MTTQETRDSLHIMTSCLFSIHPSRYPRADFNVSVSVAKSLVTRFEPDSRFAAITFGANASVSFNFKSPKVSKRINTETVLMAKGRQL